MDENASPPRKPPPVTITACPDGPLLVRGPAELRSGDGDVLDVHRATMALCRCGLSSIKPHCDGTHKLTGFKA